MDNTMSVQEAADFLGVSKNRVYALIKKEIIRLDRGRPTIESVRNYKNRRRPKGRPEGSFKQK